MQLNQIDPQVIVNDCDGLVLGGQLKIGGQNVSGAAHIDRRLTS